MFFSGKYGSSPTASASLILKHTVFVNKLILSPHLESVFSHVSHCRGCPRAPLGSVAPSPCPVLSPANSTSPSITRISSYNLGLVLYQTCLMF